MRWQNYICQAERERVTTAEPHSISQPSALAGEEDMHYLFSKCEVKKVNYFSKQFNPHAVSQHGYTCCGSIQNELV